MDVSGILREANQLVTDAQIDEDLRGIAFSKVLDILVQQAGIPNQQESLSARSNSSTGLSIDEPSTGIERIAAALSLPIDQVHSVFSNREGELRVIISHRRLDNSKKGATQELALLVAGGRQLGKYDENWTEIEHIRNACDTYRVSDESNFARNVRDTDGLTSDPARGRLLRVRLERPGIDRLRSLIGGAEVESDWR